MTTPVVEVRGLTKTFGSTRRPDDQMIGVVAHAAYVRRDAG